MLMIIFLLSCEFELDSNSTLTISIYQSQKSSQKNLYKRLEAFSISQLFIAIS